MLILPQIASSSREYSFKQNKIKKDSDHHIKKTEGKLNLKKDFFFWRRIPANFSKKLIIHNIAYCEANSLSIEKG